MWRQLVSEADHSLPFHEKKQKELQEGKRGERLKGSGASETILSDSVEEERHESKRETEMKDRL